MKASVLAAALAAAAGSGALAQEQVKITGWASQQAGGETPPPTPWNALPIEPAQAAAPPEPKVSGKPKQWTRLAGAPVVAQGELRVGEPILTLPVAHLYTGRLAAEPDRFAGVFSGIRVIPAGSPVYALPLGGELSWCAPRKRTGKDGSTRWDADCFVPHVIYPGLYSYASGTGNGLLVGQAKPNGGAIYTPPIRQEPVDFGEYPKLYYRFNGWDKKSASLRIDAGNHIGRPIDYVRASRGPDGSAILKVLDGELRLVPAGKGGKSVIVEVIRPPSGQAASPL